MNFSKKPWTSIKVLSSSLRYFKRVFVVGKLTLSEDLEGELNELAQVVER